MTMTRARWAQWLLTRADGHGQREALIGDLLEELAHGRSRGWLVAQLIGPCWFALLARTRRCARVTPALIALSLGVVLLGGVSITSISRVLETWTSCYLLAGTLSLFADVMSRTIGLRTVVISVDTPGAGGL
jgi:hypothetical protein